MPLNCGTAPLTAAGPGGVVARVVNQRLLRAQLRCKFSDITRVAAAGEDSAEHVALVARIEIDAIGYDLGDVYPRQGDLQRGYSLASGR